MECFLTRQPFKTTKGYACKMTPKSSRKQNIQPSVYNLVQIQMWILRIRGGTQKAEQSQKAEPTGEWRYCH